MNPRLSIIIPMYNVEPYIRRCLDSCLGQTGVCRGDYEIIVVNDGSTDASLSIAKSYEPAIRVFSQENQGQGAARNAALEVSQGEYVWFVDSDDWIAPEAVKTILELAFDGSTPERPDYIAIAAEISGKIRQKLPESLSGKPRALFLRKDWRVCPPFYVCSKAFLDHNGLRFKTGFYFEDNDFTPRMLYLAESCAVSEDILYHVFERSGSTTRKKSIRQSNDQLTAALHLLEFIKGIHYEENQDEQSERLCQCIKRLYEHVVVTVNCALRSLNGLSKDEIRLFETKLSQCTEIIPGSFIKCGIKRYRIELWLFNLSKIFGGRYHYHAVFRLLDSFRNLIHK